MTEHLTDADDLMDAILDTQALNCCDCPSCNFYALDYAEHAAEKCTTWALIEEYAEAREQALRQQIAQDIEAQIWISAARAARIARGVL